MLLLQFFRRMYDIKLIAKRRWSYPKTRVSYKTQEREREREREKFYFLWKLKYFTMQKYNLQKNLLIKKPKSFKLL